MALCTYITTAQPNKQFQEVRRFGSNRQGRQRSMPHRCKMAFGLERQLGCCRCAEKSKCWLPSQRNGGCSIGEAPIFVGLAPQSSSTKSPVVLGDPYDQKIDRETPWYTFRPQLSPLSGKGGGPCQAHSENCDCLVRCQYYCARSCHSLSSSGSRALETVLLLRGSIFAESMGGG